MTAPVVVTPLDAKAAAVPGRFHVSVIKPGCACSRCGRLRQRARDLRGIIAVYETRLEAFRRALYEIER